MSIEHFRHPTREEIDALVRAARRDRAEAVAGLFCGAARKLAALIARGLPEGAATRTLRRAVPSEISSAKERPMAESFWRTAAASLPPQIQWRYAGMFEAAERFERLLEIAMTAGGHARRALARTCRAMADALRGAAGILDVAARRLTLTR